MSRTQEKAEQQPIEGVGVPVSSWSRPRKQRHSVFPERSSKGGVFKSKVGSLY